MLWLWPNPQLQPNGRFFPEISCNFQLLPQFNQHVNHKPMLFHFCMLPTTCIIRSPQRWGGGFLIIFLCDVLHMEKSKMLWAGILSFFVWVFRAQSFAERLRLGIAVIHGEAQDAESDQVDGRHSPPTVKTTGAIHPSMEIPCNAHTPTFRRSSHADFCSVVGVECS